MQCEHHSSTVCCNHYKSARFTDCPPDRNNFSHPSSQHLSKAAVTKLTQRAQFCVATTRHVETKYVNILNTIHAVQSLTQEPPLSVQLLSAMVTIIHEAVSLAGAVGCPC